MLEIPDIRPVDELCKKNKVHRLYLFGSALTDKFNDRSDIDFYVEFWQYNNHSLSFLKKDLQSLFNRRVDLHLKRVKRSDYKLLYEGGLFECNFVLACDEFKISQEKALVTIALPVWKAKDICWLSMESFCRQMFPFELIVFEEEHPQQLGKDWFFGWAGSLKLAGCKKIVYLTSKEKYTLAEKWCAIAERANSTAFCFCGADDYYDENMCRDAYESVKKGFDYIYETKGYFYHIHKKKMILYSIRKYKGLMQCVPTEKIKKVKPAKKSSGVDRWIHDSTKTKKPLMRTGQKNIVCTDGFNNISHRDPYYDKVSPPFYNTDKTIFDILPRDVAEKLLSL